MEFDTISFDKIHYVSYSEYRSHELSIENKEDLYGLEKECNKMSSSNKQQEKKSVDVLRILTQLNIDASKLAAFGTHGPDNMPPTPGSSC